MTTLCLLPPQIFLDVPKPFTWILHDPSGCSEFKPMEGVEVEQAPLPEGAAGTAAGEADEQQQQQQQQEEEEAAAAGEQQPAVAAAAEPGQN